MAWVKTQLGSGAPSSPVIPQCARRSMSRGIPAGHLYVLKPGMTNPLDSAVIVATPVLQSQIGSKLSSMYAPALLAQLRFRRNSRYRSGPSHRTEWPSTCPGEVGSGRAEDVRGGASGDTGIVSSATARKELAAGEVDSRLMTVITGLAASHPVDIVAFGESGPDTAMAPFRSAELAETNMQEMMGRR